MKHVGPISGIAVHGENLVATAGYDNQIILWDAKSGDALGRGVHDHLANQCAFSPDGTLLVSASSDYSARLWSVPEMQLVSVLIGHSDDIEMAAFSPDGTKIATCSRDRKLSVFLVNGTRETVFEGHEADVISVAWSSDGTQLISSSDDGTIRRWDAENGTQLELIDLGGVETDTVIITADGVIYSGDDEGRISIFDGGKTRAIDAHGAGIKRLIYSASLGLLASLSYDKTIQIWKIKSNNDLALKQSSTFPTVVWPRSGAFLNSIEMVFGTFGSTFAVYNMASDKWDDSAVVGDDSINAVAFTKDGRRAWIGDAGICHFSDGTKVQVPSLCNFLLPVGKIIVSAGQTGDIYDVLTGDLLHTHHSPVNCATSFTSVDGTFVVLGTYTGEGVVLEVGADGRFKQHVKDIELHSNAVKGLSCDGTYIFSVSADGGAGWHATSDLSAVEVLDDGHSMIANGCATVRSGVFASVSRDLILRIWKDHKALEIETPHKNSIKCVCCTENGRYIATGGYFGQIAIYDCKSGVWVRTVRQSASGISSICTVPDQDAFLCSSYDGTVHFVSVQADF
ncbi:WD40 repeat domain-containing protein [Epibacterium ulvae]|uniref:WD40 repeat domain-containing protein n=1 Tax=Epibacterium ulvae TaxID=1156985 RepID=UPI002493BBD5|nr:WD40 repeat domain-containing protein [Epibacterium ulvae]